MNTPIVDFVRRYAESDPLRLHMPGHKGKELLGFEKLDITEIDGADSLYEANGIIRQSEKNATELFGCETYYSTEGSSLCIRAMFYLITLLAEERGVPVTILAGRNAHKTFITACAMLDIDVSWLYGEQGSYLSCSIEPETLENAIISAPVKPIAVYITTPDYLGNLADVEALSKVCHKHGVLLVVDNAHGAYLKFLKKSLHPIDLGADMCCDSAHKTLPVLTGGAYLHVSKNAPSLFSERVKEALAAFGSTSPSYVILQSLDMANVYLADGYYERLFEFSQVTEELKRELSQRGYVITGDEPLKLTILARSCGYTGTDLADLLRQNGIECEFADPDNLVLMLTPEIGENDLDELKNVLIDLPFIAPANYDMPRITPPKKAMSIRRATFSPSEMLPASECIGRVLSQTGVSCPPAVPIVVSGEIIDSEALKAFEYYGITTCQVIKEKRTEI